MVRLRQAVSSVLGWVRRKASTWNSQPTWPSSQKSRYVMMQACACKSISCSFHYWSSVIIWVETRSPKVLIATCRFSTKIWRSFHHHGKEIGKKSFRKMKKPERHQRSVRKPDEDVIDYVCEDACVKVVNVKSVKKYSPGEGGGGRSQAPTRTPCMTRLIALIRWGNG